MLKLLEAPRVTVLAELLGEPCPLPGPALRAPEVAPRASEVSRSPCPQAALGMCPCKGGMRRKEPAVCPML